MTSTGSAADVRGQRETWREERAALGLNPASSDFGRRGLMQLLDGQSVQVVLLPADPLAGDVDFDHGLAQEIPSQFEGSAQGLVSLLSTDACDVNHLIKFSPGTSQDGARAFLALARHGGMSVGLAERIGVYTIEEQRVLRLNAVAGAVRLALKAQDTVLRALEDRKRPRPESQWEISVALPGSSGSWLGAYAPGWRDVEQQDTPRRVCRPTRSSASNSTRSPARSATATRC